MLSHYIATGVGGALGAMLRVGMSKALPLALFGIPINILCINVLGCFFMGLLTEAMGLHWSASDNMHYFLISGLLGGFTTFSAFSLEFGLLCEKHSYSIALLYALLSVGLSLTFFFLGAKLIKILF